MIHFETKFFQKQGFTKEQIQQFLENAKRDLSIAKRDLVCTPKTGHLVKTN